MDYLNCIRYLNDCGLFAFDSDFYSAVNVWYGWYRGFVESVHQYTLYSAGHSKNRTMRSLKMAKKVCEDIADFLLNEKVRITDASEANDIYVKSVLDKSGFFVKGNEYQERKAATGTVAYVPYIADAVIDVKGRVVSGDVRIRYFDALHIFPVCWDDSHVINVAFSTETTYDCCRYSLIQYHELVTRPDGNKTYIIRNSVINSSGEKVTRDVWDKIPLFRGITELIDTGSSEPQFVLDKLAIANNMTDGYSNPMGIPIFANSTDVLTKIDTEYDSYLNEFVLARKRIFASPELLKDVDGNAVFDPQEDVYVPLPEGVLNRKEDDTGSGLVESNMTIRADEHEKAINQDLNLLSMKCGFGTQYYRFDRGNLATATQVISENSDLYRTIKKHELPLGRAIVELVNIIKRLGAAAGVPGIVLGTEVKVDFDDSIIQDKEAERKRDREEVDMGAMSLAEYRSKWYGEPLDVAAQKVGQKGASGSGTYNN